MEIQISDHLNQLYKETHKNLDMALMTLIDSFDPDVYQKVLGSILPISAKDETKKSTVKIGDAVLSQIKEAFEIQEVNDELINTLLWIAVLFPEI